MRRDLVLLGVAGRSPMVGTDAIGHEQEGYAKGRFFEAVFPCGGDGFKPREGERCASATKDETAGEHVDT